MTDIQVSILKSKRFLRAMYIVHLKSIYWKDIEDMHSLNAQDRFNMACN